MSRKDYNKLTIYKFYCLNESTNDYYVGSTTNFDVKKNLHKKNLTEKPTDRLSVLINTNGGWNNWKMESIEEFHCSSRKEAIERENYWYHILSPKKKNSCNHNQNFTFFKNYFKELAPEDMKNFLKYANKLYDNITNTNTTDETNEDAIVQDTTNANTDSHNANKKPIVQLGCENLHEFLSIDEQINIIKKLYSSIKYMVKHVYTKYPQFRNCKITNLQNNVAYIYDDATKQFDACDKNDVLNNLIFERINDIQSFLQNENVAKRLKSNHIEKMNNILEEFEDQDNTKYKVLKEELKYILYNTRNQTG